QPAGTAQVGPDGTWSIELPDLPDGPHTITVVSVDGAGNESSPTSTMTVVDTTPPEPPVIEEPLNGDVYLEVPVPRGRATPGVLVRLSLDGVQYGEVRATAQGAWTLGFPPQLDVALGDHTLSGVAVDDADNVSAPSNQVRF